MSEQTASPTEDERTQAERWAREYTGAAAWARLASDERAAREADMLPLVREARREQTSRPAPLTEAQIDVLARAMPDVVDYARATPGQRRETVLDMLAIHGPRPSLTEPEADAWALRTIPAPHAYYYRRAIAAALLASNRGDIPAEVRATGARPRGPTEATLRTALLGANNALADVCHGGHEHQIECHADTLPAEHRRVALAAEKALEILSPVVAEMVEPTPDEEARVSTRSAHDERTRMVKVGSVAVAAIQSIDRLSRGDIPADVRSTKGATRGCDECGGEATKTGTTGTFCDTHADTSSHDIPDVRAPQPGEPDLAPDEPWIQADKLAARFPLTAPALTTAERDLVAAAIPRCPLCDAQIGVAGILADGTRHCFACGTRTTPTAPGANARPSQPSEPRDDAPEAWAAFRPFLARVGSGEWSDTLRGQIQSMWRDAAARGQIIETEDERARQIEAVARQAVWDKALREPPTATVEPGSRRLDAKGEAK